MTTIWPVRPWRRAFREDLFLPDSVLGPVECWALVLLISARCGVDIFVSFRFGIAARGLERGRVEVGGASKGGGWGLILEVDERSRWLSGGGPVRMLTHGGSESTGEFLLVWTGPRIT